MIQDEMSIRGLQSLRAVPTVISALQYRYSSETYLSYPTPVTEILCDINSRFPVALILQRNLSAIFILQPKVNQQPLNAKERRTLKVKVGTDTLNFLFSPDMNVS